MMTNPLVIPLDALPAQNSQLLALQSTFADVCNAIAPIAQANRCWNRVALHHLTYHEMRQRFPQLGSQMICNAVYSVCRTYRLVMNHPQSPWGPERRAEKAPPLLHFQSSAPVYFDRHTLSLRNRQLSMYTLDGRLRFQLDISPEDQQQFLQTRLREIILMRQDERFVLQFWFDSTPEITAPGQEKLPEYVLATPAPKPVPTH